MKPQRLHPEDRCIIRKMGGNPSDWLLLCSDWEGATYLHRDKKIKWSVRA